MKTLPDNITMVARMYGDGARGSAVQLFANDELEVTCLARRENRVSNFVSTWQSAITGDATFQTWGLLRAAMLKAYQDARDEKGD